MSKYSKHLNEVLTRENFMRKFFNKAPLTIHSLTQEDVNDLVRSIDGSLSPENLHCDGEITRTQAQVKYRNLTGALMELRHLGFNVKSYEFPVVNS